MDGKQKYKVKANKKNCGIVSEIKTLANSYSILGVVDIFALQAPQFQRIRAKLLKTAKILIVKKTLLKVSLFELEKKYPNVSKLSESLEGSCGIIFTNDNPFSLFKFVKKNKSQSPAKAGQIAPNDILVSAGPTNFAPGPIIGELASLRIKAGVGAGGKIEIKENTVVAKKGVEISQKLAEVLLRLGIEPMEVGLKILSMYENKIVYTKDILDVNCDEILNNLKVLANNSFILSCEIGYITKQNINYMITKCVQNSFTLSCEISYPTKQNIKQIFGKANLNANAFANFLPKNLRPAGIVSIPVTQKNLSVNEVPKQNKEEKKKEPKEVDTSAGLGSLF